MNNTIKLYSISELLERNFYIPSYQRGYRWTKQQVEDLLNDINEFSPKEIPNSNEKTWYCLQPIVVKQKSESENEWEIIDGQQRLTTILLIIHYMNEMWKGKQKINEFNIKFETRDKSQDFLENISVDENSDEVILNNENIDFHFISRAYSTIHQWVKSNTKLDTGSFESKFIHSSKVIWYETSKDEDSIDIFTRLNSGKIPLTNAELIKALFLRKTNFIENNAKTENEKVRLKQLEIASEWDRIEYALQDESFWYFINKSENNLPTRIEFIFDLMYKIAQEEDKEVEERKRLRITTDEQTEERRKTQLTIIERFGRDEYATFRFFYEKFKPKSVSEINDNWQGIKKYFQTLEEWNSDRDLYHKIGYLITIGTDIKIIFKEKKDKSKMEFSNWTDNHISKVIRTKAIEELEYGVDNTDLIRVLLLHNILNVLKSEDNSLRFPFNKYKDKKNGGWSLEHIHAQNSEDISETDDFDEWLKAIDENELKDELKIKLTNYKNDKQKVKIPELVKEISQNFGEIEIHSIENMALLSINDNSKLNNGLFPVKRERIIELEKTGGFVPMATKKVFQKYYVGCTKQLSKWEEKDRNAYLNDIQKILDIYISKPISADNE
jgi:uncharacterized protein with ParB-like and HNH nuclease domain